MSCNEEKVGILKPRVVYLKLPELMRFTVYVKLARSKTTNIVNLVRLIWFKNVLVNF